MGVCVCTCVCVCVYMCVFVCVCEVFSTFSLTTQFLQKKVKQRFEFNNLSVLSKMQVVQTSPSEQIQSICLQQLILRQTDSLECREA